jgi:hypothetical protein
LVTCPKCGSANTPGSTFCIGCGTDLPVGAAVAGPPSPTYGGSPPASPSPPAGPPAGYGPPQWGQGQSAPPGNPPAGYPPSGYPPSYGVPAYGPPQINNNMAIAVVSLVVGLLGCMITGIPGLVAVIMASQVNSKLAAGDVNGAVLSARHAKVWAIVGLALAAAVLVVFFVFLIVEAASVGSTTS